MKIFAFVINIMTKFLMEACDGSLRDFLTNILACSEMFQDMNMTFKSNGTCTFDLCSCLNDALPAEMLTLWGLEQEGCSSHPPCLWVRLQVPVDYQMVQDDS